jgi:hypothetical protein
MVSLDFLYTKTHFFTIKYDFHFFNRDHENKYCRFLYAKFNNVSRPYIDFH